jgi:hypothetical protein
MGMAVEGDSFLLVAGKRREHCAAVEHVAAMHFEGGAHGEQVTEHTPPPLCRHVRSASRAAGAGGTR